MALSASVTYSAVSVVGVGAVFNYEVLLHNTTPAPFAVYGFMLNLHYDEDPTGIPPLKNVRFISAPPGWYGQTFAPGPGLMGLSWSPTGFQGDAITSGYIMPGQYAVFRFQSSTPPPDHMPFACDYYNGDNVWGFPFNGTASYDSGQRRPPYYAIINPLVFILGDELFVRLNLPRPVPLIKDLREQVTSGIQSMRPDQRAAAAEALDRHIAVLTEIRAVLNERAH